MVPMIFDDNLLNFYAKKKSVLILKFINIELFCQGYNSTEKLNSYLIKTKILKNKKHVYFYSWKSRKILLSDQLNLLHESMKTINNEIIITEFQYWKLKSTK